MLIAMMERHKHYVVFHRVPELPEMYTELNCITACDGFSLVIHGFSPSSHRCIQIIQVANVEWIQ